MEVTNEQQGKDGEGRWITGYLVGSLSTWNNAKKAEEKDRVKHSVGVGGGKHGAV